MQKTIALRGKKELIGIYARYAAVSGKQDTGRPQATIDFVKYVASLPLNENTRRRLRAAAIASKHIGDAVDDADVPTNIKITIDIEDDIWQRAMAVFQYCFELVENRDPQMPFFIKVAGTACLSDNENNNIGSNNIMHGSLPLNEFEKLDVNSKLNELYKLLIRGKT